MIYYKLDKPFLFNPKDVLKKIHVECFITWCKELMGTHYCNKFEIYKPIHPTLWRYVMEDMVIKIDNYVEPEQTYTVCYINTNDFWVLRLIGHIDSELRFLIAPKTLLGVWLYNQYVGPV